MKTLFTHLQKVANTPPTCLLVLFAWLLMPFNVSADPIAIGTGTATLNYTNTSNPAAPVSYTHTMVSLGYEECIMFSDNAGTLHFSQVDWDVTIVPGIYDVEISYGTWSYGFTPTFAIVDQSSGSTVKSLHTPGWQSSNAWATEGNYSTTYNDLNLIGEVTGSTPYYIRVTISGGYGLCVGHISFTRKDGGCASPVDASFAKAGDETGSVPMTINTCAGSTFSIPGAGSLAKAGYDFVGWSYNSTTYAPGASFTMPATDVTFTAVWEQHYVPAVTGLSSSVSGNDVTLNWTNYNKMKIDPSLVQLSSGATSSNAAITGWSVTNGVFDVSYETTAVDHYATIEIKLPKEINHVSSIGFDYIFNSSITGGGLLPYMMYNGDAPNNPWGAYWTDYTAHDATSYTSFTITPDNAGMWGWLMTSGTYDPANKIHLVGFMINPHEASSGTFSIKDIYINTYDGQTLLDEVIVVRKQGSAPASVTDGTQVYAGLLNTCSDNGLADGDYYYAVFAREGDAYSAAVVEQVHIGAPSLTYYERAVTPGEYGTVCIGYAVEHENISGAAMYEIDSWSADGKALTLSELGDSESMVAGRPYIFYATGNLLSLGYDGSAAEASVGSHNGLIGSYSQAEITANDDNYIIYQNKLWLVDVLAYVGEHRAYIHKTNASPAPGRRQIRLFVAGTEVATGLDQIVNGTSSNGKFIQDGRLFIRRDERTYNAQGIEIK